jgi:photosystem II stability/assembly factor-like uncharacterized protein
MLRVVSSFSIVATVGVISLPPLQPLVAQQIDPARYEQLKYRYIGPEGNRATAVVGIPGAPRIYYAGAASGGIWKTTDGGTYWEPIFDHQPVASIGALAVAPSDHNVIWAGTGESNIRSHVSIGAGVYKSTDAGKTWHLMGLEQTGRISRVVIDPRDPDKVFVAAQGHSYGPQQERGIFRTMDGGATWEHVLFVDENTGASSLVMDPNNPRILFAGMWQLEIHTWGRESGGPGSGIFVSRDGGDTWTRLSGNGLPEKPVGKVALAIAPTNSNRVYALIETGDGVPLHGEETDSGELWRSDDGGENWRLVSYDRQLAGRTHYYSRVEVAPDNENEAFFLSAAFSRTLDGGATTIDSEGRASPWGDNHDIWIDPLDPDRMAVANDGGLDITLNRGETWRRVELPIAQMYHVTVDTRIPYYVYGNRQDGQSARGPSRTFYAGFLGSGGNIPRGDWQDVGGGESGWATPDPVDPNIVWSSASGSGAGGGIVTRMDLVSRQVRDVEVWPRTTTGWAAADLKYRFVWDPPLTISPHDHNKVYTGSQYVHVTTDGGQSWHVISPDLTLNDKSKQGLSGGLTPDNIGVEYAGVVFAISESPLKPGLIWAGTNDGLVHVTRDDGETWTNVTDNIPDLPSWGTVSNIEPSRYDTATAYLAVDAHQANNRDPWVYKTTNYGRSWKRITNGIPVSSLSYANCVREDPVRQGLLYLGTENALYVSFDDGENWQPLQTNLPHAPVYWMVVQEQFNDLVVATYGRGFWILDDLTPLQQLTEGVGGSDAHVFQPRPAYRFKDTAPPYASFQDPTAGQNPPYGASINYYLPSEQDSVEIEILDDSGEIVRKLDDVHKEAGINRVWWNLRFDRSTEPRLRTSPQYAPWVKVGDEGWRSAPGLGRMSVMAPPGDYTVRLTAGGQQFTQQLSVLKDPNSLGTEADIATQTQVVLELKDDLDQVVQMVNTIETVRSQLDALNRTIADDENAASVEQSSEELDTKLTALEETLIQLKLTGRGQDAIRWPSMLGQQISYLADKISMTDFAPTDQQMEVKQLLEEELQTHRAQYEQLISVDVAEFNSTLAASGLQGVIIPKP